MLDLKFIREHTDRVRKGTRDKNEPDAVDQLLELDATRRKLIGEVEKLKHEKNVASQAISEAKKAGADAVAAIAEMRAVSERTQALDTELRDVETQIRDRQLRIPNIPHGDVPVGDESANREVRSWGEPPSFAFTPAPHWELGEKLGIFDGTAAANISGTGFTVLRGAGARLQRALINFMLDHHT